MLGDWAAELPAAVPWFALRSIDISEDPLWRPDHVTEVQPHCNGGAPSRSASLYELSWWPFAGAGRACPLLATRCADEGSGSRAAARGCRRSNAA